MHPMKRKALIVLLGLGTVVGYGSGVASMRCHAKMRRAQFEEHVAKVCADAAIDRSEGRRGGDGERRGWDRGGRDHDRP